MTENEIINNIEKDIQNEIEVKVSSENQSDMEKLAKNDGFETMDDFWTFFNEAYQGMIIHWTDTRY